MTNREPGSNMEANMKTARLSGIALIALASLACQARQVDSVFDRAAQAMGVPNLRSIEYSGSGSSFGFGQSGSPGGPWPRFIVPSYVASVDYEAPAMRQEIVRNQLEGAWTGGANQPIYGERRQAQLLSRTYAWNQEGTTITPSPAAVEDRLLRISSTPHGVVKAAMAGKPTVSLQTVDGKQSNVISFAHGTFTVKAFVNDQNLVEKVETLVDNPVLGDILLETSYSNYRDFGGVQFPARIVQRQGGFPILDINITSVRPNASAPIEVPATVQQPAPPLRVASQKMAEGVWYLTGGTHHSVLVEFNDHAVVVEGPQSEARSLAVIAEVAKLLPTKPIRYLVNTHHHFDHSGGIRTFAAEGAVILTHEANKPYFEKVFAAPRTMNPDRLARSGKQAVIETVGDKRILSDGSRILELHFCKGLQHSEGMLFAYLPKEKLLVQSDLLNYGTPNFPPPPARPNPTVVSFYENVQRLKLQATQILSLHGPLVTIDDLRKMSGNVETTP